MYTLVICIPRCPFYKSSKAVSPYIEKWQYAKKCALFSVHNTIVLSKSEQDSIAIVKSQYV